MAALTDIALPSFDDETALWGDADPVETMARYRAQGVSEIVVKNGPDTVHYAYGSTGGSVAPPRVENVRDTTGAGDSFNAGYLAARVADREPRSAIALGHELSAEVIAT